MPKRKTKPKRTPPANETNESLGYLHGLFQEFNEQLQKYSRLVGEQMALQARVELSEKNLRVTRDHFTLAIERTEGVPLMDWTETLALARFVGERLSDACIALIKDKKRISNVELLRQLNDGQYRFRTNTPYREIHGALLKQPSVVREGEDWLWTGEQPSLKVVEAAEVKLSETA